jgi:hypothetical protein
MASFVVTDQSTGKKFKITAPDQAAAIAAFRQFSASPAPNEAPPPQPPTASDEYAQALEHLRQTQYSDMSPEQFQRMVANTPRFQPANLGDLAKNGAVLGLGDEIDSAMEAFGSQVQNWMGKKSPGFGEAFANNQRLQDARLRLGREQSGGPGTAVEVGGSLLSMGPARAGVEALARGVPQVAARLPLIKTAAQSGGVGAGLGAVSGAANATGGLQERLGGAAGGAALGFGVGAAVPFIARGAGEVVRNVRTGRATNEAARQAGIRPQTARMAAETMAADGTLSPQGLARMRAAGPEGMIADAGPSARNMLDMSIQSSGRAGRTASAAIDARVGRDAAALQQALDNALGTPQGVQATRAGIRNSTAQARGSAYDQAYAAPIDYSSPAGMRLEEMLARVSPGDIAKANELMRMEGHRSHQILAQIADDGQIVFRTMPDVRQVDYITRALNDRATANAGLGKLGGQTNEGRIYGDLSGDIRSATREAVPEYGTALDTAADPIRRSQAVEFGAELLSPRVTRDQVAIQAAGMSQAERAAAAQGLRSRFDDILANVKRTVTDGDMEAREAIRILKELSSRANREKIATVIGPQRATALFREVDRAAQSFELRASVADNSRTFQRQEMKRRIGQMADPDTAVTAALKGEPVNAAKRVIRNMTGQTPERALSREDLINQEIAQLLTQTGGQGLRTMEAFQRVAGNAAGTDELVNAILATAQKINAPLAYQSGRLAAAR